MCDDVHATHKTTTHRQAADRARATEGTAHRRGAPGDDHRVPRSRAGWLSKRKVHAEIEAREAANLPIYPRECAERIAQETHSVAPDWRHVRPTLGPAWGRLLKAQPELAADITAQREATMTAVFNSVPRHLRASVNDLRLLIDLMLMAREAAAYHVGYESGRLTERAQADGRGRTVHPRPHVRRATRPDSLLRLHDGATGEGGA